MYFSYSFSLMGKMEIEAYLKNIASTCHVSASTQSSALNAIAFLYRIVLKIDMPLYFFHP